MKKRSTARCVRRMTCWSFRPAGRRADSAPLFRPGMEKNRWLLPSRSARERAHITNIRRKFPMTLRVLDPRQSAQGEAMRMAPALLSLNGAVIRLLDNAKIGTKRLFDFIHE